MIDTVLSHSMVALDQAELHVSLRDPVLESLSFLNEVMDRYPAAISFAPGAPYSGFFDDIDIGALIARYSAWLAQEKRMSKAQIQKHLYQYGPSAGQINGLIALALWRDEAIMAAENAIVVTVGCQEALLLILRALFAGPDDVLAVVNPCFAGIAGAASLLGVEILAVEESDRGIDCAGAARACSALRARGKRVRAMYVAPDFSNPSGTHINLANRHALLALAEQEDFLLIEDNAYGFTASPEQALPSLKALDRANRVLYVGTCAKTCMPGVRIGFVVADQPVHENGVMVGLLAEQLAALKSMVTVNTSPICQAIVGGMLLEHDCSLKAMSAAKAGFYRNNMGYLLAALDAELRTGPDPVAHVSWNRPQGGFFVRMRLPVKVDMALLDDCASRFGVLWTPMSFFMLGGEDSYELRLSCSYLTAGQIDQGVRRLGAFLRDVRVRAGASSQAIAPQGC